MARSTSPCTADNCEFLRQSVDLLSDTWRSYVLGHEAMKRMGSSNVLIVGLKGLGVEIGNTYESAYMKFEGRSTDTRLISQEYCTRWSQISQPLRSYTGFDFRPLFAVLSTPR